MADHLREHVARNWWVLLVRGLGAIAFGILALNWPLITLKILVLLFGAHALVDGVTALMLAFQVKRESGGAGPWGSMILVGILGIAAGLVTFAWPKISAIALLYVIAWWAIVRGVFEIVAAVRLRKVIDNEWLLGLAGLASVVFGFLLIARPAAGALSLVWLIGSFAIAFGILEVLLSFKVRGLRNPDVPAAT